MKKIFSFILLSAILLSCISCGSNEKNLAVGAKDLLDSMFKKCPTGELSVEFTDLGETDADEFAYHFFTEYNSAYKETSVALASISSIPFFVGIVSCSSTESAKELCEKIEENMNLSKWVCATAESAYVERASNTVVLIMDIEPQRAESLKNAFLELTGTK